MLNDYKPSKAERDAIERAYVTLANYMRSDWELNNLLKQERSGYGNRNDAIPLIAAKALLCKWFLYGLDHPDQLLRDTFALRSAAVYMQGLGARKANDGYEGTQARLTFMVAADAHEAAFDRSMKRNAA
tara:strand:- start:226 stop:612 length:387 start_codon:yes stop_codon:yes gene_type:complete